VGHVHEDALVGIGGLRFGLFCLEPGVEACSLFTSPNGHTVCIYFGKSAIGKIFCWPRTKHASFHRIVARFRDGKLPRSRTQENGIEDYNPWCTWTWTLTWTQGSVLFCFRQVFGEPIPKETLPLARVSRGWLDGQTIAWPECKPKGSRGRDLRAKFASDSLQSSHHCNYFIRGLKFVRRKRQGVGRQK